MSRILVFDLENRIAGEVHATVKRGWMISDGDSATFTLTDAEALLPCMQLGRMVFVDGAGKVPDWSGMIDTPWSAISPVVVTAYDIPYLMSRRCPFYADTQKGDTREVALRFVQLANQLGDLYLRQGEMATGDPEKSVEVNSTSDWAQLKALVTNAGMEMQFRSEINAERRLVHYLDLQKLLGSVTPVVLQDGDDGNMQIASASLDGEYWNAVMGINNASTTSSRLTSEIVIDQASVDDYRMRNRVEQFNTTSKSALQTYTENFVKANGKPTLKLEVGVRDTGNLFSQLRLGNVLTVRATKLILPGGRKGWSGQARVGAMNYDEGANQLTMALEGQL